MNNNEYSIIMTRIITLELLPQGNLDSSRGDNQGSHIPGDSHKLVSEFTISFEQLHLWYCLIINFANLIQLNFTNINNLSEMYM